MYHHNTHNLCLALVGGLFFLTQALAAAMPQSSPTGDNSFPSLGIKCTMIADSPAIGDCIGAYRELMSRSPPDCTSTIFEQWDYITVGTCTVHTYSQLLSAACIDPSFIQGSVKYILDRCADSGGVQGSFTWTTENGWREGVKLCFTGQC